LRDNKKTRFPNTPKNLPLIAQQVAEIQEKTLKKIVKITQINSKQLFNL